MSNVNSRVRYFVTFFHFPFTFSFTLYAYFAVTVAEYIDSVSL